MVSVWIDSLHGAVQVDRLCVTVDTPFLVLGENRLSVCLSLRYYASETSDEYRQLEYCCTCAFLPGYDDGGQKRHTLMQFLPDERPATDARHAGDPEGFKQLYGASEAPRNDWLAVIAELNADTLR